MNRYLIWKTVSLLQTDFTVLIVLAGNDCDGPFCCSWGGNASLEQRIHGESTSPVNAGVAHCHS